MIRFYLFIDNQVYILTLQHINMMQSTHALKRIKTRKNNYCHFCDTFFKTRRKLDIHIQFYHTSENPIAFIYPKNHHQNQREILEKFCLPNFNEEEEENDPTIYLVNIVYNSHNLLHRIFLKCIYYLVRCWITPHCSGHLVLV